MTISRKFIVSVANILFMAYITQVNTAIPKFAHVKFWFSGCLY